MQARQGYVIIQDPRPDKPTYGQPIQIRQEAYMQLQQRAQELSKPKGSQGGNQVAALGGQLAGMYGAQYAGSALLGTGAATTGGAAATGLAGGVGVAGATGGTTAGLGTTAATTGAIKAGATAGGVAGTGATTAGTTGAATAGGAGLGSSLAVGGAIAGGALGTYQMYRANKATMKNAQGKGAVGGAKQGWKDSGWLKYTGTPAVYNAVLGAGVGLFGSKKHKDQQARDRVRASLRESGALDEGYNLTLSDGSKYGIGADGKSVADPKLRNYNVDFNQGGDVGDTVRGFKTLALLNSGGNKKTEDDFAGYYTNAARSSGDWRQNAQKFYADQGFDHSKASMALHDQFKQGRISAEQRDGGLDSLDQLYGVNAYAKGGKAYAPQQPTARPPAQARPPVQGRPIVPMQMGGTPQVQPKPNTPMNPQIQGQIQTAPRALQPKQSWGTGMLAQVPRRY